jgi:hypothetical protein
MPGRDQRGNTRLGETPLLDLLDPLLDLADPPIFDPLLENTGGL